MNCHQNNQPVAIRGQVLFQRRRCISGLISAVYISYALLGSGTSAIPLDSGGARSVLVELARRTPGFLPKICRSSPFRPSLDLGWPDQFAEVTWKQLAAGQRIGPAESASKKPVMKQAFASRLY